MDLTYFLTALASFFAIMNPIANTPIFLGLSADASPKERVAMALKSVALAWLIIALFSATGQYIFQLFGISIGAFRIAGGLLIALVGYHMLQGKMSSVSHSKTSKTQQPEQAASDQETVPSTNDSWVSPLAIPILAGPGSIATAMSLSSHVPIRQFIATQSAIAIICIGTAITFLLADRIYGLLGQQTLKVITRLMGLILAVVGVEMFIAGTKDAWAL